MTIDKTIFGLRFGSNEEIAPTRDELDVFLASPIREGETERLDDDLTAYRDMQGRVSTYEQRQLNEIGRQDFREKIFYTVLNHSCFFSPSLTLAIEQYKFYLHAFTLLDFRKTMAFIRTAEETIINLDVGKKKDTAISNRLKDMIAERRKTLETLKTKRGSLSGELAGIARYVTENLTKIRKIADASLEVLEEIRGSGEEEKRLINDVKALFKEQLKDALHSGPLTKKYVETVKRDVDTLIKELADIVREDLHTLVKLHKAVRDHVAKHEAVLNDLAASANQQEISFDYQKNMFTKIGQTLVALVSEYQFPVKAVALHSATPYKDILGEKRKELLDRIFELLRRDRRTRHERRTIKDRRTLNDPEFKGPDRRRTERRSGKGRR